MKNEQNATLKTQDVIDHAEKVVRMMIEASGRDTEDKPIPGARPRFRKYVVGKAPRSRLVAAIGHINAATNLAESGVKNPEAVLVKIGECLVSAEQCLKGVEHALLSSQAQYFMSCPSHLDKGIDVAVDEGCTQEEVDAMEDKMQVLKDHIKDRTLAQIQKDLDEASRIHWELVDCIDGVLDRIEADKKAAIVNVAETKSLVAQAKAKEQARLAKEQARLAEERNRAQAEVATRALEMKHAATTILSLAGAYAKSA